MAVPWKSGKAGILLRGYRGFGDVAVPLRAAA
jgi:hypothetical protein